MNETRIGILFCGVVLLILLFTNGALAVSGITYHGRLLRPDGKPVASSSVQFRMQIRTPGAEDCLMYEELHALDLSETNGIFAVSLGNGKGVRQDAYTWTLFDSLSNRKSFNFNGSDCAGSAGYSPEARDNRNLRVYFNDGSFSGWEELPTQTINYLPMSIESYAVGGFPASSLLRVETAGALEVTSPLTSSQYNEILNLVNGNSPLYEKSGELNGSALPSLGVGEVLGSDGSGGWLSVSPLTSESDPMVAGFAKSSPPICGATEFLKSDGSSLYCASETGGWTATDADTAIKGIVNVPLAGGLSISNGQISLPDQILTPGTYTKVTVDQKGRVASGDNIDGGDITSGTIGGATSIETSGNIVTSGDIHLSGTSSRVTSNFISTRRLTLLDDKAPVPGGILLRAPPDVPAGYEMVLPSSRGSKNQILGMNDAGDALENKSITAGSGVIIAHSEGGIEISAADSGGTVTSVTGASPISVVNGEATPVISLDDSGVTDGTYGSSTQVPVFSVDGKGRVTAVTNSTIAGVSPVGSALLEGRVWIGDHLDKSQSRFINIGDIRSSAGPGGAPFFPLDCTASQAMTWNSPADILECVDIYLDHTRIAGLTASHISNVPSGDIASSDLQAAVNELDLEKLKRSGDAMVGNLDMTGNKILNVANVPFVTVSPALGQNGQSLRWDNSSGQWDWFTAVTADSDSGIQTFNGESGRSQILEVGATGLAPNWVSGSDRHILNIPMASGTDVIGGLISKTDYDNFSSKIGDVVGSVLAQDQVFIGNSFGRVEARFFGVGDLKGFSGNPQVPGVCTNAQTMIWSAITDLFTCENISIAVSQIADLPAALDHYVQAAGDTMTGPLTLPSNGLGVGGSQLVVGGGNVGIGTSAPMANLDIYASSPTVRNRSSGANRAQFLVVNAGNMSSFAAESGVGGSTYAGSRAYATLLGGTGAVQFAPGSAVQMTLDATGNVGIGTTGPATRLDVAGQARSINSSGSVQVNLAPSVDWNNGNTQSVSVDCATTTFTNMMTGGTYILAVTEAGASQCEFSQPGLTFYFSPANGARDLGKRTIYTFVRVGGDVYVSWIKGFE